MAITRITNNTSFGKKIEMQPYHITKATGYLSLASGIASVAVSKAKKPMLHKSLGLFTIASAIGHIAYTKWSAYQYKALQKQK